MQTPTPAPAFISIGNLSKDYAEGDKKRTIFKDMNLEIGRGEFVALLGQSGSGKSTLLNLLGGIDLPDAGTIRIEDRSLAALTESERTHFRRRHIGFVFQFFNLIPTLTVQENLWLPLELNGLTTEAEHHRATELLAYINLGDRRDSFPERLSGGEQQRLAIARAMVHRPLLLLADEPTGNLDHQIGAEVMLLLENLHHTGTTLIVVTHDRELGSRAHRQIGMRDGKILTDQADDTH